MFQTETRVLECNQLAETAVMRASPEVNKHAHWLRKQLSGAHKQAVLSQSQFVGKGE